MAVTLVKSAPSSRKTSAYYSTSSDKSNGFTRQSSASEQLDQSRRSLSFGRVATLAASQCTDLAAFRRLLDEEQLSRMMKQPQQQQMGGGPALSMRGAMPPMQHTLPMTHRSQYGGASKGRLGAYSAVGGGSFAPSLSSSSFFTRHNPHPNRVRHMQGLLNVPICHVSDDGFQPPQRPLMTPERR
ncbi:uncharacterized protein LOC134855588 [Symsagittifera roscoffensis]|uniref:uncharacterized protein LOC134855588 n=1 Tax=Symsagittifera roscoffensis TaxID=84072 RepID=UPI00307B7F57